ncbi:Potassium transport protein [Schizosaccharomyces pombe]
MQLSGFSTNGSGSLNTIVCEKLLFKPNFVQDSFIIGMTILCSVILYGSGNLRYIDALLLASGSCTQTGLQPVDLTQISIYQQLTILLFGVLSTPITVNLGLTLFKLYFYNKRYDMVITNNKLRMTYTYHTVRRRDTPEPSKVGNRKIRVLLDQGNQMHRPVAPETKAEEAEHQENEKHHRHHFRLRKFANAIDRPSFFRGNTMPALPSYAGVRNSQENEDRTEALSPALGKRRMASIDNGSLSVVQNNARNNPVDFYIPSSFEESSFQTIPEDFEPQVHDHENQTQLNHHLDNNSSISSHNPSLKTANDGNQETVSSSNSNYSTTRVDNDPHVASYSPQNSNFDHQAAATTNDAHQNVVRGSAITIAPTPVPRHNRRPIYFADDTNGAEQEKGAHRLDGRGRKRGKTFAVTPTLHRNERSMSVLPFQLAKSFTSALPRRLTFNRTHTKASTMSLPYLSYNATVGRNSAFYALTPVEREELAGIEYESLRILTVILVVYFLFWHILGLVAFLIFIYTAKTSGRVVTDGGINRGWWAAFTSSSLFDNLGYSLNSDSLNSFQKAIFPQVLGTILIFLGNTFFPIMLRFIIWIMIRTTRFSPNFQQALYFLFEHPRRSFTLLFPSKTTWVLFLNLTLLNFASFFFFMVLDLGNSYVDKIPVGYRIMNAIFQNAATRSAGFTVVDLSQIAPAVMVTYMFMMYISAYIAMSIRQTNVYEERSLGIYAADTENDDDNNINNNNNDNNTPKRKNFLMDHIQRQLSHDLWYLFLGYFVITIVEGRRLESEAEPQFTLFAILFEVISGYGTVGLSLGYKNDPSLTAQFRKISKLVMVALQIRGRHRGLPSALDRAVLMPSDKNFDREEEDYMRRHGKKNTNRADPVPSS